MFFKMYFVLLSQQSSRPHNPPRRTSVQSNRSDVSKSGPTKRQIWLWNARKNHKLQTNHNNNKVFVIGFIIGIQCVWFVLPSAHHYSEYDRQG